MQKRILAVLIIVPTIAFAQSHEAREREEVIRVFGIIIPQMDVKKGDGIGSNVNCVFTRKWDPSFHRDADGEPTEQFYPHEQLTVQQAIDPLGQHADMFCDYDKRDAQAQQLAQAGNKTIAVASVRFSYPDFAPDLQTASVYYQRWSKIFLSNKRRLLPLGSDGVITLKKQEGRRSFKLVSTGTMN